MAKKLTATEQSKVDKLAKARDLYSGKGTKEGASTQNLINKIFGIDTVHDTSNLPTAKQMRIAKAGRSGIVAGMKAEKTGIANVASKVLSGKTDRKWGKATNEAVAKAKKDKTKSAGD